jgi:hypothetical protein
MHFETSIVTFILAGVIVLIVKMKAPPEHNLICVLTL